MRACKKVNTLLIYGLTDKKIVTKSHNLRWRMATTSRLERLAIFHPDVFQPAVLIFEIMLRIFSFCLCSVWCVIPRYYRSHRIKLRSETKSEFHCIVVRRWQVSGKTGSEFHAKHSRPFPLASMCVIMLIIWPLTPVQSFKGAVKNNSSKGNLPSWLKREGFLLPMLLFRTKTNKIGNGRMILTSLLSRQSLTQKRLRAIWWLSRGSFNMETWEERIQILSIYIFVNIPRCE